LLGVKIGAELLPIGRREAREAVDLLDEQHVVGPGVGDEPKRFLPHQLRARLVLDILPTMFKPCSAANETIRDPIDSI
jgi:hypothetical protein